jgi:hypothetical protein
MTFLTKTGVCFVIGLMVIYACSNPSKDYSRLEQLQNTKEQFLQQDYNYDLKIQACNEVIDSLQVFIIKHNKGEWNTKALAAINTWKLHKEKIERDKDYENLMNIQQTSDQTQGYTNDYDIKIQSCNDVINSINSFLVRYNQDEAKTLLTTALNSWKAGKPLASRSYYLLMKELMN